MLGWYAWQPYVLPYLFGDLEAAGAPDSMCTFRDATVVAVSVHHNS